MKPRTDHENFVADVHAARRSRQAANLICCAVSVRMPKYSLRAPRLLSLKTFERGVATLALLRK
jgi:hypothetical protein